MSTPAAPAAIRTTTLLGEGPARRLILPILASVPGLAHAFTVKGSETTVVLREAAGPGVALRTVRQAHGARVWTIGPGQRSSGPADPPEGDALVTAEPGVALGVFVADCVPVLLCDGRSRGVAAVHAGWRGTVAGVLRAAIDELRKTLGARPTNLKIAIGPSIGPCCFEVGDEVVESLLRSDPGAASCILAGGGRHRIDLVEANRRQALQAGVPPDRIQASHLCTRCREDLLESYRRSGSRAGRMAGIIAWKA